MDRGDHRMSEGILGTSRGLEWHQAVAPVWEVGEIATYGLALSRPRRGFESRWGPNFLTTVRDRKRGRSPSRQASAARLPTAWERWPRPKAVIQRRSPKWAAQRAGPLTSGL